MDFLFREASKAAKRLKYWYAIFINTRNTVIEPNNLIIYKHPYWKQNKFMMLPT